MSCYRQRHGSCPLGQYWEKWGLEKQPNEPVYRFEVLVLLQYVRKFFLPWKIVGLYPPAFSGWAAVSGPWSRCPEPREECVAAHELSRGVRRVTGCTASPLSALEACVALLRDCDVVQHPAPFCHGGGPHSDCFSYFYLISFPKCN